MDGCDFSIGTSSAQITVITKRGQHALMSKRIFLDAQEKLQSDASDCLMVHGTAARANAATAAALAEIVASCGSDQAIALGALKEELPDSVMVTIPSKIQACPGAITRSRNYIDYRQGTPAWCLLDFDTKGMRKDVSDRIEAAGGIWQALVAVAPDLTGAARVSRASTSAGLFRSDTGAPVPGSNGMHHYILVHDGGDIDRFLRDLHDRCWLHGFGWHLIGRAGQLLDRSIVDRAVGFGERLCFEGAPLIVPPLAQDQAKRAPEAFEGEAVRSDCAVPRLSEYERHKVNDAKATSAGALGKTANEIRDKHDNELADKIRAKSGMPLVTALRLVKARHRGVLFPHIELEFDALGIVTVGAVLAEPNRYIGETLADPMEGVEYGRCKAMVMRSDFDGALLIHSFAHGRGIYLLRYDFESAKAAFAQGPDAGTVDQAMAIFAQTEIEADEQDQYARLVSKTAGIGLRPLQARIKKERKEREDNVRAASRKAAMDAEGDTRIVRPRPEEEEELLPIVSFCDDLLAKDPSEEPPMRDALGALVRVEEREPWALHLLTSVGTNATVKQIEDMKPPTEPMLTELSETGVEMMLEHYVRWVAYKNGVGYFATLPKPFIRALMEYPTSTIPVVRAINTAPIVTAAGQLIDGDGLDRATGLFHRIDPVLRACLPQRRPTELEIKAALDFLLDEWLVDVTMDDIGKCVAILLELTLIERALLSERPAFLVTAGQSGGGKTTLIYMLVMAVFGRRPSAASWSEDAEERKKALFAYLRQGVACLVWDNLLRGTSISCPHIEKTLSATEISDRVLGVSDFENVPATTVQIFTGNAITTRGEMANRTFMMSINVNRPDPENRSFVHADPLGWTQTNRAKILRALYTILVGGVLRRADGQIAKTRFKLWWELIGWSVEYAASLRGIKFDCAELIHANTSKEEEASATVRALTLLRKRWPDNKMFTTRDVVRVIESRNDITNADATEAEELFEALGNLVGKTLENPTPQSIGKLFQKCLTDRPAWIEEGLDKKLIIAVLRKDVGHQENRYKVELAQSTGEGQQTQQGEVPPDEGLGPSPDDDPIF